VVEGSGCRSRRAWGVSHAGSAAVRLLADRTGKRKIKIPETWAWAHELHACFLTIFALPPPP
jgi:hypothetical protein